MQRSEWFALATVHRIQQQQRKRNQQQQQSIDMRLHFAAEAGDIEQCQHLITILVQSSCDCNIRDRFNNTPLHWAAMNGHKECVELLIEARSLVDATNRTGLTPLHYAVERGASNIDIIRVLLEAYNRQRSNQGNDQIVVDCNTANTSNIGGGGGSSNIIATATSNIATTTTSSTIPTTNNREGLNFISNNGFTPLHYATESGSVELIDLLVNEGGADINHKSRFGTTPLTHAATGGDVEVVRRLLMLRANADIPNQDGTVALHRAAENGHDQVIKVLLEHGVRLNVVNSVNRTPLHLATRYASEESVLALLEHKADPNATPRMQDTALHRAVERGSLRLVTALLDHGAQIDAPDYYGYRSLHLAIQSNQKLVVKLLLDRGADPSRRNNNGKIPIDLATNDKIRKLILDQGWWWRVKRHYRTPKSFKQLILTIMSIYTLEQENEQCILQVLPTEMLFYIFSFLQPCPLPCRKQSTIQQFLV